MNYLSPQTCLHFVIPALMNDITGPRNLRIRLELPIVHQIHTGELILPPEYISNISIVTDLTMIFKDKPPHHFFLKAFLKS